MGLKNYTPEGFWGLKTTLRRVMAYGPEGFDPTLRRVLAVEHYTPEGLVCRVDPSGV